MQLFYQRFNVQEYLLFTLLAITALILFTNFIGLEMANDVSSGLSITLSGIVTILSFFMVSKYGIKGNHGKAWILFMLFSAYWVCAESVDVFYNVVTGTDAWKYADDFFYITGYQLFFSFLVFYLRPFVKQITKKILVAASLISLSLLIPSLLMIVDSKSDLINENLLILLAYPILDSIILVPALIGVILFFKGGVNFMVSLLCLGIITQIIGDNSVLFLTLNNIYYPGHLVEILFLWTYTLFSFGLSNQIGLFRANIDKNSLSIC